MPNRQRDNVQLLQLIHNVEQHYPRAETDLLEGHLAYLLEGLISQSSGEALQFFKQHKGNGILSLRNLPTLTGVLADQLLRKRELQSVEELLQVAIELHISVDTIFLRKLAKAYRQEGNFARARKILFSILKQSQIQPPEIVRDLYDIARLEGQDTEAHALLQQLIQVDSSPATVAFAYKERSNLSAEAGRPIRIALLSSYTLDPLVPYLDYECRSAGLAPEFYIAPFNQYVQEVLQLSSDLYRFQPEIVFIGIAIDDLYPEVKGYPTLEELSKAGEEARERVGMVVDKLCGCSDAMIVVYGFVLMHRSPHGILDNKSSHSLARWIEDLNRTLEDDFRTQERVYLLPLEQIFGWVGREHSYNPKMQYMAAMRLSGAALLELARYSMRYVKPLKGLTRKCIVLDLDGTLWGG